MYADQRKFFRRDRQKSSSPFKTSLTVSVVATASLQPTTVAVNSTVTTPHDDTKAGDNDEKPNGTVYSQHESLLSPPPAAQNLLNAELTSELDDLPADDDDDGFTIKAASPSTVKADEVVGASSELTAKDGETATKSDVGDSSHVTSTIVAEKIEEQDEVKEERFVPLTQSPAEHNDYHDNAGDGEGADESEPEGKSSGGGGEIFTQAEKTSLSTTASTSTVSRSAGSSSSQTTASPITAIDFSKRTIRYRVKLYGLDAERHWDDKGTGHVSVVMHPVDNNNGISVEAAGGGQQMVSFLVVRDESDGSEILHSLIRPDTSYQRQQDTLIVWSEKVGMELALSFQERAGCEDVWARICHIQGKDPTEAAAAGAQEEIVQREIRHDGAINEDDEDDAITGTMSSSADMLSSSLSAPLGLRPALIENLESIRNLIKTCMPSPVQRDRLAAALLHDARYISKLLDIYHECEYAGDYTSLYYLYSIFFNMLMLNSGGIYERLFGDESTLDALLGALEYDPKFCGAGNQPHERKQHRRAACTDAHFREIVPIESLEIRWKIIQIYKVQYIFDVILPTPAAVSFEECMLSSLASFLFFTKADIASHLQQDEHFMQALIDAAIVERPNEDLNNPVDLQRQLRRRRDVFAFLKEYCGFSQTLDTTNREKFYRQMVQRGILKAVEVTVKTCKDAETRGLVLEVFASLVEAGPSRIRDYCLTQAHMGMQAQQQQKAVKPAPPRPLSQEILTGDIPTPRASQEEAKKAEPEPQAVEPFDERNLFLNVIIRAVMCTDNTDKAGNISATPAAVDNNIVMQLTNILKSLLDPEVTLSSMLNYGNRSGNGGPQTKTEFLAFFYRYCMQHFIEPLVKHAATTMMPKPKLSRKRRQEEKIVVALDVVKTPVNSPPALRIATAVYRIPKKRLFDDDDDDDDEDDADKKKPVAFFKAAKVDDCDIDETLKCRENYAGDETVLTCGIVSGGGANSSTFFQRNVDVGSSKVVKKLRYNSPPPSLSSSSSQGFSTSSTVVQEIAAGVVDDKVAVGSQVVEPTSELLTASLVSTAHAVASAPEASVTSAKAAAVVLAVAPATLASSVDVGFLAGAGEDTKKAVNSEKLAAAEDAKMLTPPLTVETKTNIVTVPKKNDAADAAARIIALRQQMMPLQDLLRARSRDALQRLNGGVTAAATAVGSPPVGLGPASAVATPAIVLSAVADAIGEAGCSSSSAVPSQNNKVAVSSICAATPPPSLPSPLTMPLATAQLLNQIVELATFCIDHHSYYIKHYVIGRNLLAKILELMRTSPHMFLVCTALRALRRIVGLNNDFYNRYIERNDLFRNIIDRFMANGPRNNMFNSAVLELFEFIRNDDNKTLATYVLDRYWDSCLKNIRYVSTFQNLKNKFSVQQVLARNCLMNKTVISESEAEDELEFEDDISEEDETEVLNARIVDEDADIHENTWEPDFVSRDDVVKDADEDDNDEEEVEDDEEEDDFNKALRIELDAEIAVREKKGVFSDDEKQKALVGKKLRNRLQSQPYASGSSTSLVQFSSALQNFNRIRPSGSQPSSSSQHGFMSSVTFNSKNFQRKSLSATKEGKIRKPGHHHRRSKSGGSYKRVDAGEEARNRAFLLAGRHQYQQLVQQQQQPCSSAQAASSWAMYQRQQPFSFGADDGGRSSSGVKKLKKFHRSKKQRLIMNKKPRRNEMEDDDGVEADEEEEFPDVIPSSQQLTEEDKEAVNAALFSRDAGNSRKRRSIPVLSQSMRFVSATAEEDEDFDDEDDAVVEFDDDDDDDVEAGFSERSRRRRSGGVLPQMTAELTAEAAERDCLYGGWSEENNALVDAKWSETKLSRKSEQGGKKQKILAYDDGKGDRKQDEGFVSAVIVVNVGEAADDVDAKQQQVLTTIKLAEQVEADKISSVNVVPAVAKDGQTAEKDEKMSKVAETVAPAVAEVRGGDAAGEAVAVASPLTPPDDIVAGDGKISTKEQDLLLTSSLPRPVADVTPTAVAQKKLFFPICSSRSDGQLQQLPSTSGATLAATDNYNKTWSSVLPATSSKSLNDNMLTKSGTKRDLNKSFTSGSSSVLTTPSTSPALAAAAAVVMNGKHGVDAAALLTAAEKTSPFVLRLKVEKKIEHRSPLFDSKIAAPGFAGADKEAARIIKQEAVGGVAAADKGVATTAVAEAAKEELRFAPLPANNRTTTTVRIRRSVPSTTNVGVNSTAGKKK